MRDVTRYFGGLCVIVIGALRLFRLPIVSAGGTQVGTEQRQAVPTRVLCTPCKNILEHHGTIRHFPRKYFFRQFSKVIKPNFPQKENFGNYSPRMRWSRACNHVRSFCQGVADSGESAPSVAAAGFNN
jgi:hypothetical protein